MREKTLNVLFPTSVANISVSPMAADIHASVTLYVKSMPAHVQLRWIKLSLFFLVHKDHLQACGHPCGPRKFCQ